MPLLLIRYAARFILLLIFTLIGGALLLYARRAPQLTPVTMDMQQRFTPVSRETLLLLNNLLLTCACAMVLLGTLIPCWPMHWHWVNFQSAHPTSAPYSPC